MSDLPLITAIAHGIRDLLTATYPIDTIADDWHIAGHALPRLILHHRHGLHPGITLIGYIYFTDHELIIHRYCPGTPAKTTPPTLQVIAHLDYSDPHMDTILLNHIATLTAHQ